ncbi:MAG: tRNA uridine-5-carboxymethylaminomethyl(34) synthesis GTPase MnmE [Sphingomonadaceae bacterium]|nr:tRNA uridine-5-carboxymethylaminomethyl(34) synthesis GTPase MnmE [Sphingomonadaceae bacterium]
MFALATGATPSAIAIIRISGSQALAAAARLGCLPSTPRALVRARLRAEDGSLLDDALVATFLGPASATGDDVVELHLHGGPAVVAGVTQALIGRGLTPARGGDFTRRAFENGKLDLSQVEALGDLLYADTEAQRRAALTRTGTGVAKRVDEWRRRLLGARADLEATLDFAEEDDIGPRLVVATCRGLHELGREIDAARVETLRGERLTEGVTIAIVGPTNAGKSTLLNAMMRRDAAMVSPVPGTTRDVLEFRTTLGGIPVTLIDTAGLRDDVDALEAEGIRRGQARAAVADIRVAFDALSGGADTVAIAGKSDLTGKVGWIDGVLHLSPRTGAGLELLEADLVERLERVVRPADPPMLARRWQASALASAAAYIMAAIEEPEVVLAADSLRRAGSALDELVGRGAADDLLDAIFARFCIGK